MTRPAGDIIDPLDYYIDLAETARTESRRLRAALHLMVAAAPHLVTPFVAAQLEGDDE